MIPEHSEVTIPDRHSPECQAVNGVLARVGDKWSVLIIVLLGQGTLRFNEIKKLVAGISQRMLTLTLRGLERDGLVTRTVFPTIPPRVDYALTDLGRSLWQAVEPLGLWARGHVGDIHAAQNKFDKGRRWLSRQPRQRGGKFRRRRRGHSLVEQRAGQPQLAVEIRHRGLGPVDAARRQGASTPSSTEKPGRSDSRAGSSTAL